MINSVIILLEAINNQFCEDDNNLIKFWLKFAKKVDALVLNSNVSQLKSLIGINKAYIIGSDFNVGKHKCISDLAMILSGLGFQYNVISVNGYTFFHNILCRSGAILNRLVISGVYDILKNNIFVRNIGAGKFVQQVNYTCKGPWLISVKLPFTVTVKLLPLTTTVKLLTPPGTIKSCKPCTNYQIIDCSFTPSAFKVLSYKKQIKSKSKLPLLSEANIVIAGGRSFGSAENFNRWLNPLAKELGAAIGGTRAAVEAGYISPEFQIGHSGKIISPKIYIAFGISGSNHHMVGVKNAETIIAVNIDVNAPIVAQA
ncbi:MAG: electron transfer flavoprotein subunit alpha/FixB family protein, partial [Candidatus Hodgkinia cicadicola]